MSKNRKVGAIFHKKPAIATGLQDGRSYQRVTGLRFDFDGSLGIALGCLLHKPDSDAPVILQFSRAVYQLTPLFFQLNWNVARWA